MKFREEDIKLLLDNSFVEPSDNYEESDKVSYTGPIVADTRGCQFVNTQVNSIRRLYVQLAPKNKESCKEYLLLQLSKMKAQTIACTAFNTLIHLGFTEESFLKIANEYRDNEHNEFYVALFLEFDEILEYEWTIFTQSQVDELYKWFSDVVEGNNELGNEFRDYPMLYSEPRDVIIKIWKKLNAIKTKKLKDVIFSETNFEITSDEKALKVEFVRQNFPDYLSETLDKIDLKIATAGDNFDFSDCMKTIRTFSESLFNHIAESLDPVNGKKINGQDSEKAAKFFVKNQLISENQASLIIAFRHFLSNEGVHRLKSRSDDARLSRNMMIELSLYLLLRLKDLKDSNDKKE